MRASQRITSPPSRHGVVFLRDPLTPHPHEPDISAIMRVCDVHNVPLATNMASADLMLLALANGGIQDRTSQK